MRQAYLVALVLVGCLPAAQRITAQTPAAPTGQSKPADAGQKQPAAPPQAGANPFPEDTSNVPVLPSSNAPALPEGGYSEPGMALPGDDVDPVRSPDDPAPGASSGQEQNWSSSQEGMDKLLPGPDDDQPGKRKRKGEQIVPEHHETSGEDITVGNYYLDRKDWKAALSRFQSALVLAPEEPEVYWGLAESARHLGNFADARAYYEKVAEYDPDSRHGKEAIKALKEPEIAHAKSAVAAQPQTERPK